MDAAMMKVMGEMDTYRRDHHHSYEQVAEGVMKSAATVRKQFTQERGSCTLYTAYAYAQYFGGRVVFVLDSDWAEFEKVDFYREKIQSLEADIEHERAELEACRKHIDDLIATNAELVEANRQKSASIDRKDKTIEQLSENNNKLINKLAALI